jgi:pimeloyl-ACP methyl ester carboxylesterase
MTHTLIRPGGTVSYELAGQPGSPLVLLGHGMADSSATFRFLGPRLVEAGYRVATVDLRGHGRSSAGWSDYSTTAIAGDFLALLDELSPGAPAAIVGNSYSAGAAVIAAHDKPDAIRALVLTGPAVRTPKAGNLFMKITQAFVTRGPLGRPLWMWWWQNKLFPKAKPADFAEQAKALNANLGEKGRMAAAQAMMRVGHDASAAVVGEVTAPALVVMGGADPDFPDATAEADWVAGALGGPTEKVLVDGVGHYPQAEAPDEVTPVILDFLRKN